MLVCYCSSWDGKQGPVKDVYSLANNPQYKLEVNCPQGGAAVWVLLTRHITDKVQKTGGEVIATMQHSHDSVEIMNLFLISHSFLKDDFAQNREFITLVVYKSDGKKVYYPGK